MQNQNPTNQHSAGQLQISQAQQQALLQPSNTMASEQFNPTQVGVQQTVVSPDPTTQMNTFLSYVSVLAEHKGPRDEIKLKAAQELNENFEAILQSPQYPQFLDHSIKMFLKILENGEPQFISEHNIQQVRKLILEMIHRFPTNELLRPYVKAILTLVLKLLEIENEENTLVCLRIIIELHKTYKPSFNPETQTFLRFVKSIYANVPSHLDRIFEPRAPIRVKDFSEIPVEQLLADTFTITLVHTERRNQDETIVTYNLIPRGTLSLKILQELPIIVVLFYQMYKPLVQQDICDYIKLILNTITLQPTEAQRKSPQFNEDVFMDFISAQIKMLTFIAYTIPSHLDVVSELYTQLVTGVLGLLATCPHEACHLRKELLIAVKHIFASELKQKFIPHMEKLFDESVLLGNGCTVRDNLRPLAYSTLADLVHQVRADLPMSDLARAVHFFGKVIHDPTLTTTIQTMSCKLLLNLVDCIKSKSKGENAQQSREFLMRMLEIFVLKFKTFAKLQLPILVNRSKVQLVPQVQPTPPEVKTEPVEVKVEDLQNTQLLNRNQSEEAAKSRFGFPQQQMSYNVIDYRNLVKTLVFGVKTITWGCANATGPNGENIQKKFSPQETLVFIRLVKWAMKALDIYQVPLTTAAGLQGLYVQAGNIRQQAQGGRPGVGPQTTAQQAATRNQDDKDVLEHFSGLFSQMTPDVFKAIFSTCVAYMVDRIHHNTHLQVVINSFLAKPHTSPVFATVLVEYLLGRMPDMGQNAERSGLYLRLFKLVFGSVSMFPAENEHMLRPHLHQIVNRSMELAMTAKEPYNYFLLLRALFRSIGGGSHDLLYQEFLPLLPNLLEGLNRLQSGLHKPHMKDLFVELCLTVPVRLSSLLPYLPMLMDPLVSALNGSHTLISQGLRTLELCVDNLQPDFLYEHIQPVRADLMQALWRTLRNQDHVAHVAFRVLGKFGGGNRKMMIEPQKLEYNDKETPAPAIIVEFQGHEKPIEFPVDKIIETAVNALKSSSTDSFYHKQCWEVIRCYLAASLNLDDNRSTMLRLFLHPSFEEAPIRRTNEPPYKCSDKQARDTHQTALTGMFVAAAIRDLRVSVLPTMIALVRHYTMVAVAQQAGPFPLAPGNNTGIDPLVLVDAIAVIMAHEEKELCKPGHVALNIMLDTATLILGTRERACQLPLFEYLSERLCSLCYERAWYQKLGGCIALGFLLEKVPPAWLMRHAFQFLRALMFVMMDLCGEVSSGALDKAKYNLEKMLRMCTAPIDEMALTNAGPHDVKLSSEEIEDLKAARDKALYDMTHELVRLVTSPHTLVREQAMYSLHVLAGVSSTESVDNDAIAKVMEPHRDVLADMVPPTRHQLKHQPANAQIGLMDGNTFCMMVTPRLFNFDLSIKSHNAFFEELVLLCDSDDTTLSKLPCYKSVADFTLIRKSALRCLSAYKGLKTEKRDEIFTVLYKALEWDNPELQEAAYDCMQKFIGGRTIEKELLHKVMRPLLLSLGDHRNLNLNVVRRLSYLTRLFPSIFKEKLCDQLLQHLNKFMENLILQNGQKVTNIPTAKTVPTGPQANVAVPAALVTGDAERRVCTALQIFAQVPDASARFVPVLIRLVLNTERQLADAVGIFRAPLMKFLLRFPTETLETILAEQNLKEQQYSRYLLYLVRHADGKPFRDHLQSHCIMKLISYILITQQDSMAVDGINGQQNTASTSGPNTPKQSESLIGQLPQSNAKQIKNEIRYQAVRMVSILIKHDDQWIATQTQLVEALKTLWCDDTYQSAHSNVENVETAHWKEPKSVVKILLQYFIHCPNEIDLLFQLLRAFCYKFIPDFQFLRNFLENTVAQNYTVEWKQQAFYRFVDLYKNPNISQQLKAYIVQFVLIPCFSERSHDMNTLVGSDPQQNVVSVFINKVIDQKETSNLEDCLRIALLQFSCLLVEQASHHIHDATNKRQGNKLRKLMTFAWPCLLGKNCVDAMMRYHGHLLLAHIIVKFAINKKIVLQVFHKLVKAHAQEARAVVRQALEILTPAMPLRMEGGATMLIHWTKKIIVEEGHSMPQLYHILQLVVRHYKVYYPVRHHLIQYIISSINRLGFQQTSALEHKKLAVELAEVVIKWELQRIKDESDCNEVQTEIQMPSGGIKREAPDEGPDRKKLAVGAIAPGPSQVPVQQPVGQKIDADANKPIKTKDADAVLNFLLRLACHVNESTNTPLYILQAGSSPGELLSKRCVALLKTALKPDVWPQSCDLKLAWLDKVLQSVENSKANFSNIGTALELLIFLLTVMKPDKILTCFKPLQKGLGTCLYSKETKVITLMHNLLSKLMILFPPECSGSSELDILYATVGKMIVEGLTTYEKNQSAPATILFGPLTVLKACCGQNSSYIDRFIAPYMRVIARMAKEHLTPVAENGPDKIANELLILGLDLVKTRVVVMSVEMRKQFIGQILVGLIEKTPDAKIMRAIVKMVEEWVKSKNPVTLSQAPSLREKSILLVKLMQYVEKRFPNELELNQHFLEIVNYVYRDDHLKSTELAVKLEPAFMAGLRCSHSAATRARFFSALDASLLRQLHTRLLYIVCSQAWDAIGAHYWLKQCIELLLVTAVQGKQIQATQGSPVLPSVGSVINMADSDEKKNFIIYTSLKQEPEDYMETASGCYDTNVLDIDLSTSMDNFSPPSVTTPTTPTPQTVATTSGENAGPVPITPKLRAQSLREMVTQHASVHLSGARRVRTGQLLAAAAQLCHADTPLAERMWLELFPRMWSIMDARQHATLIPEMVSFVCSGAHVLQKDCHPSAIMTFVEALTRCTPGVPIKPPLMKYLGKSHNLWHRMTLNLEQMAFDTNNTNSNGSQQSNVRLQRRDVDCYEFEGDSANLQNETLESLADMYVLLCEEDMWCGLWQQRAHLPETAAAVAFEQHGWFERAQAAYEQAMQKYKMEVGGASTAVPGSATTGTSQRECLLWEQHWIRCAKELNQWDLLVQYGESKAEKNPFLILDSAWRIPNWQLMKEALAQVEYSCPKEMAWKVNLYRGFLAICHSDDKKLPVIERCVEAASVTCMRDWRRLPRIVSHAHLPLLQAAQQIMELQEAMQIHQGLMHTSTSRSSLHDMKAIVKTWRNRLPVIADDLSHWSDIFTWRQHHYQFISSHYDNTSQHEHGTTNHAMLGVHASAQAIIHFGKIARKHNLTSVCLDSLSRIYTIPSVPIVDCFQKIRQQVKCYLQMAAMNGKNDLHEGLEVVEKTNLTYFTKEMTSEFYALKGILLAQIGRSDDANKAFSAAVQLHDVLVKAWALWGEYLEAIFTRDRSNISTGVSAITCFLHACRHQNESKSRKYLAKVLWLLTYDDEKSSLMDALDKYCVGVPAVQWLPWTPQLVGCLVQYDGEVILNLLSQVGRVFPQAVYFPMRTLYLMFKIEQRVGYKSSMSKMASAKQAAAAASGQGTPETPSTSQPPPPQGPKASPAVMRCTKILQILRDIHPIVLLSLEGFVDQMIWFRETWYEEVLKQLRQCLTKCYAILFENRANVTEAKITPHMLNFVKKLVSTFGIGIENVASSTNREMFSSSASESLAKRKQATEEDPVFQKMKTQFTADFDFNQPNAMRLHNLIFKLNKWIRILENKAKVLPKSFLIEEKCPFLSNFSLKTAEVELPGEFLLPKHSHYYVRIARFMPRVDVVQKHNTAARRLYIRGHNGKIYPYLVVIDSGLGDARREERVLQLLRMLNLYLGKQKETSRRFLHFTVPRVVAVSPQMRLVEDNPASVSLLDIYKQGCNRLGVDPGAPITLYYERLAGAQARRTQPSHGMLREILKAVHGSMIPKTLLKTWAIQTFPDATDYWTFRKMLTLQLSLACFAEYVLHLTRLNPEALYVHRDSGLLNVAYFKFDVDDANGESVARPVPFRLTPNLYALLGSVGVEGPLTASVIATARCLVQPNFKVQTILRAILKDEMVAGHKKSSGAAMYLNALCGGSEQSDNEFIIASVNKAVSMIVNRLNSLAVIDVNDSKVATLVAAAKSPDNLCRMDPTWHPWL